MFWDYFKSRVGAWQNATALVIDGASYTYAQIVETVERKAAALNAPVLIVSTRFTFENLTDYLASRCANVTALVLPLPQLPPSLANLQLPPTPSGTEAPTILFTSGTTGAPKGVVQPNKRYKATIDAFDQTENIPDVYVGKRMALLLPPVSAGLVGVVMRAWLNGGTLVSYPQYAPPAFPQQAKDLPVEEIIATPSHACELIKCDLPSGSLNHLKNLYLVGEPIYQLNFRSRESRISPATRREASLKKPYRSLSSTRLTG